MVLGLRVVLAALWLVCAGCHGAGPTPATAESSDSVAELPQGPLADYVPAPTLRWLLLASPQRVAEHPGLLDALAPLVDEAAWQRFSDRNGVDPRVTASALIAGFELGTLYMVSDGMAGPTMVQRFRDRLLKGEATAQPHPRLLRVRGVVGESPQALLHAKDRLVALSVGDPTLVRLVEGYLLGRFRETPPVLSGAALGPHAQFEGNAPLRLFVPDPAAEIPWLFEGPLASLRESSAALLALELFDLPSCKCRPDGPTGPGLRLHWAVAGPWAPSEVSAQPLLEAWEALSLSATGQLLQLHPPLNPPRQSVSPLEDGGSRLELRVELALKPLVRSLQDVLSAELEEIFRPVARFSHVAPGR
jgi:hypothetical protein